MSRRLLAALAALALAVQAGSALAAFAPEEPHACSCPMRGKGHHCDCADCARHRCDETGQCSLGGCSSAAALLVVAAPAGPFLPAPAAASSARPARSGAPALLPIPLRAPARDVPTPPPLR